jgi:O-methyltransferase
MLIELAKRSFFLQSALSRLVAAISPMVDHNLQKYVAIKKAFYLTALEQLPGDYLEFGVFTGSSFVMAMRAHRSTAFCGLLPTRFFGFDSFSGFGKADAHDQHPFYTDAVFKIDENVTRRNIERRAKGATFKIIPGFFNETLTPQAAKGLGIEKIRVAFIDCDLKDPAALCLEFIRPALQPGTILLMDDFLAFRGSEKAGVAGAFKEFCERHPALRWRRAFDYGYGGAAYILSEA